MWGWIAKIKILVFELKNAVNFGGLNRNFSQKKNLSKSEIVLVGDVGYVEGLASILGCGVALLLMKYLASLGCSL